MRDMFVASGVRWSSIWEKRAAAKRCSLGFASIRCRLKCREYDFWFVWCCRDAAGGFSSAFCCAACPCWWLIGMLGEEQKGRKGENGEKTPSQTRRL